jgi:predicted metal-dependent HD superfamily phosphohydrolase
MTLRERKGLDVGRWTDLMSRLGLASNLDTFERLQTAYAEKHRHYHTSEHINDCLLKLDEARHLAQQPDEVELALWFHDAVYATRSKKNEAKSAAWATEFLTRNGVDSPRVQRVHDLVMATRHDAPVDDPDAALMVDLDLSILGADEDTFERFERNVLKEYWWVPAGLFKRTRASILQSFLDRASVYGTDYFRQKAEAQARRNLAGAIAVLSNRA